MFVRPTGSRASGFRWVAGHVVAGETVEVLPMIGASYRRQRTVEAFGSTKAQALAAYQAMTARASVDLPGEDSEPCATLAEAVALVAALRSAGKFPSIRCDAFRASPVVDRLAVRPVLRWSMSFAPNGIYKSLACRQAEYAGVRYASHRRGYVASDRAFQRFCASWDEFCDRQDST